MSPVRLLIALLILLVFLIAFSSIINVSVQRIGCALCSGLVGLLPADFFFSYGLRSNFSASFKETGALCFRDEAASSDAGSSFTVTNIGVGHYFPSYVTPKVMLQMELIEAKGRAVAGSARSGSA